MGLTPSKALSKTRESHRALEDLFFKDPEMLQTCTAETTAGTVRGFQTPSGGCCTFRGIPYAVAERFQKPQRPASWKGELSCLRFGPACPQPEFGFVRLTNEGFSAFILEEMSPPLPPMQSHSYGYVSEKDCLNLNLYTPSLQGSLPVLIFFHGGAFQSGSNSESGVYDGTRLCEHQNMVVIAANSRIGPFGFLNFPEQGITNLGIRDQIAALEWVRDNVSRFGGDPSRVTLMGQSSGAMSMSILLQSPKARGLFHGAILMSGGPMLCQDSQQNTHINAVIEEALQKEGYIEGKLTPEAFSAISQENVVKFMQKMQFDMTMKKKLGTSDPTWTPYRGDDVLPMASVESLVAGCPPILVGCMADEWLFFRLAFGKLAPDLAGPTSKDKAADFVSGALRSHFGQTLWDDAPGDADRWRHYGALLFDKVEEARLLKGMPVDVQSVCGGCHQFCWFEYTLDYLARTTGCYSYTIHGPAGTRNSDGHFREVPLVFNFGHELVHNLYEPDMLGSPAVEEDRILSETLMRAFGSFVKTRRPEVAGKDWPAYPTNMHLKREPAAALSGAQSELYAWFDALRPQIIAEFNLTDIVFKSSTSANSAATLPTLMSNRPSHKHEKQGLPLSRSLPAATQHADFDDNEVDVPTSPSCSVLDEIRRLVTGNKTSSATASGSM